MELYQVSECIKKRVITHIVKTSGGDVRFKYGDIRAGASFPAGGGPCCLTVVGQNFCDIDGLLGFSQLAEIESDDISPDRFFNRMTDYASMYGANTIYCDMSANKETYVSAFHEYQSKVQGNISLIAAPFSENFSFSVGVLRDFYSSGKLTFLKDGKCREQLKGLSTEDLNEKTLEEKLYAVNAMRFVMSSFLKFPVLSLQDYQPAGEWRDMGEDAWMAS